LKFGWFGDVHKLGGSPATATKTNFEEMNRLVGCVCIGLDLVREHGFAEFHH
jgi:hypothetical protein